MAEARNRLLAVQLPMGSAGDSALGCMPECFPQWMWVSREAGMAPYEQRGVGTGGGGCVMAAVLTPHRPTPSLLPNWSVNGV